MLSVRLARGMPDQFTTVRREGRFERLDRGSRFIGICRQLDEAEDAERLLDDARVLFPQATHYVYAWRISRPVLLQRFSDDGEPQGTAGRQVLEVLIKEGIDMAGLVVIRYFGGVKLGTGGLTRAYSQTARGALSDALPVEFVRCHTFALSTDYAVYHQLSGRLESEGYFQQTPVFGETVRWIVGAAADRTDTLREMIMNISAGGASVEPTGEKWLERESFFRDSSRS